MISVSASRLVKRGHIREAKLTYLQSCSTSHLLEGHWWSPEKNHVLLIQSHHLNPEALGQLTLTFLTRSAVLKLCGSRPLWGLHINVLHIRYCTLGLIIIKLQL